MSRDVHIIQRQHYEIIMRQQKTALDIQQRLEEINTMYVLPQLAEKMDKYFSNDEVVTIDKLELNLGKISKDADSREWARLIIDYLEIQLKLFETVNAKTKKHKRQHLAESWIWYLRTGVLPAGSIYNSVREIIADLFAEEKTIIAYDEESKELIRWFLLNNADGYVIRRIISLDLAVKKIHIQLVFPDLTNEDVDQLDDEINAVSFPKPLTNFYKQRLWENVFNKLIKKNVSKEISIKHLIEEIKVRSNELKAEANKDEDIIFTFKKANEQAETNNKETASKASMPEPEIFISNAGLCLLAPWLTNFFKETGLVNENKFIDHEKQAHAIYLLHYLITKETDPTEEVLLFPKLLCGWPLQMPVFNKTEITGYEINECEDLLNSVIQNWFVLKNTTTEGLRESFLQRSGKMTEQEDQFIIQPEQRSIDLLLEYIPWTFRMIRLPWMKKSVQIDWY
jgi:hypothetical protein